MNLTTWSKLREIMLSFEKNTDDGDDVLVFQEKLERMNSGNNLDGSSPRKVLIEQLQRVLPADDSLPDQVDTN